MAYRTLHGYVGAALGESDAVPGVVSLSQSFGSLAHWHPHLHLVVTDGAFRRDGGFVTQRSHDAAMLVEAWRRAVLSLLVRENWLEQEAAASMLAWPHSGFSAHVGPAIAAEDRAAVLRVARYGSRAPVAPSRLRYDAEHAEVELSSDAVDGPYAGVHRMAAVAFVARLVQHIPGKGEVRVRYYGAYASRRRGWWRRRGVVLVGAGQEPAHDDAEREVAAWPALRARRRRWAELLRLVFEVDVTVCPDPPSVGTPRRRDADHRVPDRARGGHAHPRALRAGRRRCARRTLGGGGVGTRRRGVRGDRVERASLRPPVGEVCAARPEGCRAMASAVTGGRFRGGARARGRVLRRRQR